MAYAAGSSRWSMVMGSLLALATLAAGQENSITVTSPTSDDEIYASKTIEVLFDTEGAVAGPYAVDLFRGNTQVHEWCSSPAGCPISGGSLSVSFPSAPDPGAGYKVVVSDQGGTGVSGMSEIFEVTEAPEVEASSPPVDDEQVVGGDEGAVGHMNTAIFAVAIVVGVALVTTLCILCCWHQHRKRKAHEAKLVKVDLTGDVENTVPNGVRSRPQSGRGWVRTESNNDTLSPTDNRSAKSFQSSASLHPYSVDNGSEGRRSSSRSRGDARPREATRERADGGPKIMSTTPSRSRDDTDGPRMMSTTPSKHQFASAPGRYFDEEPDNMGPRMYSSSPVNQDRRGPRMYSPSVDSSWDGQGGRTPRMFVTTPTKERAYSARERTSSRTPETRRVGPRVTSTGGGREEDKGHGPSRSASVGQDRRPRHYSRDNSPIRGDVPQIPRAQRNHNNARGRSREPVQIYRRSRSVGRRPERQNSPPEEWEREVHRQMEARGAVHIDMERWDDARRDMRMIRRSKSVHSILESEDDPLQQRPNGGNYRRSISRQDSDNFSGGADSPGRHKFYRSGLADAPRTGHDVSWEEIRWRYMVSQTRPVDDREFPSRSRRSSSADRDSVRHTRGSREPHTALSDTSSVGTLSIISGAGGRSGRGPPPPYRSSPKFAHLSPSSETSHDTVSRGFARVRPNSTASQELPEHIIPRSASSASSGQARALHARAAARDAQISAERALAAAAAASRAADAAAQAATEAEAEADAELGIVVADPVAYPVASVQDGHPEPVSIVVKKKGSFNGGAGSGSEMGHKKARSVVGENLNVFASSPRAVTPADARPATSEDTIARSWSISEEGEVNARAEASAEQAKADLANVTHIGTTEGNGETGNDNVAGGLGGPDGGVENAMATGADTAGGSRTGAGAVTCTPPRVPRDVGRRYRPEIAKSQLVTQRSFDADSECSAGGEHLPFYPSTAPAVTIPSPLRPLPRDVGDAEEMLPKILSKRRHIATRSPTFELSPTIVQSTPILAPEAEDSNIPLGSNGSSLASTVVGAVSPKTEEG